MRRRAEGDMAGRARTDAVRSRREPVVVGGKGGDEQDDKKRARYPSEEAARYEATDVGLVIARRHVRTPIWVFSLTYPDTPRACIASPTT